MDSKENSQTSVLALTSSQKAKIEEIRCIIKEKKPAWENIILPTGIPIPGLDEAIKLERADMVNAILESDYDLALQHATFFNCPTIVPILLRHVKNIHAPSKKQDYRCALHFAAMNGMDDVVKLLISEGAYIHFVDIEGNTPLHLACLHNHADTACTLLKLGAMPTPNHAKQTPGNLFRDSTQLNKYRLAPEIQENAKRKLNLPSLANSNYGWIVGNLSEILIVTREGVVTQRQEENNSIDLNIEIKSKLEEIFFEKYTRLSTNDLINLDKTHKENLNVKITYMLHQGYDSYCINLSKSKLQKFINIAQKIVQLEDNLGCKLDIHYEKISEDNYLLKSKTAILNNTLEKLVGVDKSLYTISEHNELFIKDIHLEQFINALSKNTPCLNPQ